MRTHTLASLPAAWIGRPVALLDDADQPIVSGVLAAHDVRRSAPCDACGHQRGHMAHIALIVGGLSAVFDLPADTRITEAKEAER